MSSLPGLLGSSGYVLTLSCVFIHCMQVVTLSLYHQGHQFVPFVHLFNIYCSELSYMAATIQLQYIENLRLREIWHAFIACIAFSISPSQHLSYSAMRPSSPNGLAKSSGLHSWWSTPRQNKAGGDHGGRTS